MLYRLSYLYILVIVAVLSTLVGCVTPTQKLITPADVGEPKTWGGAQNVVNLKHLYFSAQPDAQTFTVAKANGVGVVINLREPGETDWNAAGAANAADLEYFNVPIAGRGESLDEESISRISAIVQDHQNQNILLYCSSGNRASAWLAVHLIQDHELTIDAALAVARKTGLNRADIEARVFQFQKENGSSRL